MPDETPGTGQPDRAVIESDDATAAVPVVDDDVDFYDDEPGAAVTPPADQPADKAEPGVENPWREPSADNQPTPPAAEKPEQARTEPAVPEAAEKSAAPAVEDSAAQESTKPAAEDPPAAAEKTAAQEPTAQDAAAAEPTVAEPTAQESTDQEPAKDQAAQEPAATQEPEPLHPGARRNRVNSFDDLSGPANFLGGLRLPGSIESELDGGRPSWRPPLLVWVITGLFVSIATMCTFLYPAFTGYDEPFHVDMTYSYYNGNGFYAPAGRYLSIGVQNAVGGVIPPPTTPWSQHTEAARAQRQSFDALGGDTAGTYPIPNQMVQHPPLYYAIGAVVMHLVPGSRDLPYDQWVAILRYMSILMIAPVPILAWASAKALVGDGPMAVAASALPLTLPNLTRVGGNVNNDNLLTLLTAVLILLLCKVIAGDLRKRTGFWVGLVTALACLTKGTALVLPVVVSVAYAIAWMRHRRRPWAPFGVAALVTATVGGWWWIRNLLLYNTVQPEGFGGKGSYGYDTFYMIGKHPPAGTYTVGGFIPAYLVRVLWRTWGGIGYPEQPFFARTATWIWFGIVAAGSLFAVCYGLRGRFGRVAALFLVLPTLLILSVPMSNALHHYLYNGVLPGAQGRYLYPTVTAVGVVVGVGYCRLVGRKLAGWIPLVLIIGALGTQVLAWRQLIKVWWVPTNVHGRNNEFKHAFRAIELWSPWSHLVTAAPFIAVLAFSLLLLAAAVGYGIAHRDGDDEPMITDGTSTRREQIPMRAYI